jgi:DNA replication protein DnaC
LTQYGGVSDLSHTFANMRLPKGFGPTLAAFKTMAAGTAPPLLLVYGGTGNGKSRCCEALAIALYDKGVESIRREKWSDIVRFTLKAAFHGNGHYGQLKPSYEDVFKLFRERRYLIIDDVGMGSTGGNWEWGELEDIVDFRWEHKLFTVITTNLDIKELPPRIVSRFRDKSRAVLVCNETADQRPMEEK